MLDVLTQEPPTEDEVRLASFKKKDLKARSLIIQCTADNILDLVKSKTTAKGILDTLSGIYKKQGIAMQVQLQSMLRSMKYIGTSSLNDFLVEYERTVQ